MIWGIDHLDRHELLCEGFRLFHLDPARGEFLKYVDHELGIDDLNHELGNQLSKS